MDIISTTKQNSELDSVVDLFATLGYELPPLCASDRPDVKANIQNRIVGIEVTTVHSDETAKSSGSRARAIEQRNAQQSPNAVIPYWGHLDPNEALIARITKKVTSASSYDTETFDELWLLVTTSLPLHGAVASTLALPVCVSIERLNFATHELLSKSRFSSAFIHSLLCPALYRWSAAAAWQRTSKEY